MFIRQRLSKSLVFLLLLGMLSTFYPIRNATERFNDSRVEADANETAVGSSNAAAQASISAGDTYNCALSAGAVKCWGFNGLGSLGDGTNTNRLTPVGVSGLSSGVTAISAGDYHACALSSGAVKCWGYNSAGQLGDGTNTNRLTPVGVSGLSSGVTAISAGDDHTCALSSGAVKCWGENGFGQLGDGTTTQRTTPVGVSGLSSGVTAITAFGYHTCALLSTGAVKCWGNNGYGQLGNGNTSNSSTPVGVSGLSSGVTAITAGLDHTCALLSSGEVKCWGYNRYGQLGTDNTSNSSTPVDVSGLSGVTAITAAYTHTCALLTSGAVQCWGYNQHGQLGDGTTTQRTTPVGVSGLSSGVTAITASGYHTCALLSTGAVKCWGYNVFGQLGDGTTTNSSTPVGVLGGLSFGPDTTAPTLSSAAVNSAGKQLILQFDEQISSTTASASNFAVTVAGASRSVSSVAVTSSTVVLTLASAVSPGQSVSVAYTAPSSDSSTSNAAIQDSSGNDAASFDTSSGAVTVANHSVGSQRLISLGHGNQSCAVTPAGGVKCWGSASSGRLGNGVSTNTNFASPVDVIGASDVVAVASGGAHGCALTASGGVKCWGSNFFGANGTGSSRTSATDVTNLTSGVAAISAGSWHTCALLVTGRVKCWGANTAGQLGDGTTTERNSPVDVRASATDSTPLSGVTAIAAAADNSGTIGAPPSHTCALLVTGGVKCWGYNYSGFLGDGTTTDRTSPVNVLTTGTDQTQNLLTGVTAISAARHLSCAVTSTARVKCWGGGYSQYGNRNLGNGTTSTSSNPLDGSSPHPVDVHTSSTDSTPLSNVTGISVSPSHTCALLASGHVKCWGHSYNGDGNGSDTSNGYAERRTPVYVLSSGTNQTQNILSGAIAVSGGDRSGCVLLDTGDIKCWGSNSYGQLGDGTTTTPRPNPVTVTGFRDVTAPSLNSARTNGAGTQVTLTFDESLSSTTAPLSAFSVVVSGTARIPTSIAISGTTAVLEVSPAILPNQTVLLNYSDPSASDDANALQDATGNDVASMSAVAVTNRARVSPAPVCGASSCSVTFSYIGDYEEWSIPTGVTSLTFDVRGASGGDGESPSNGGLGGKITGTVDVTGRSVLYMYVGGAGTTSRSSGAAAAGGWNGGGASGTSNNAYIRGGGGGASDIRTTEGDWNDSSSLLSRLVVAGGGGGANRQGNSCCRNIGAGGAGGGSTGGTIDTSDGVSGRGGTQSAGGSGSGDGFAGSRGTGGAGGEGGSLFGGGGGGGGYFGGGGGNGDSGNSWSTGGGGGSSYPASSSGSYTNIVHTQGSNTGNGQIVLTYPYTDTTVPTFVSAAVNTAGTKVILTYSEALSATTASASAFSVVVGGSSRSVSSAVVSGSTVELTLASAVATGESVTVAYTDPSGSNDANAVQDSAGNDAASLSATSVTNNADSVSPSFVSAATNSAGDQVTLTFGEALSSTTAGASAFSVVVNGTAVTPSSVTVSGSTVVLAVSPAIQRGDTVTFAYTAPSSDSSTSNAAVQDSIGNDVGSISATSVTNSSTVDTRTPTFVSAVTSANGTKITLTYSEALSATTASASAFSVVVGGSSRSVSSAVVSGSTVVLTLASAVGSGQSVTVAYTDPSGSNDANAVQDSAGNDAASLSATSVTNNVPQPSSGGAAPTNGTTTSTSSTTTTTTIFTGPRTATTSTSTSSPRRSRSTSTTLARRVTTTTVSIATTTSISVAASTTTTSTSTTTTTTIAPATITSVASSAIQTLQQAEEKLKTVEAQTSAVTNDLRAAQIQVGESRVAVLDPKSALVVAVSVAEGRVASLSAAKASNAEIAAAITQLEDLKIAIAQNVTISIEKIATAQAKLAAVLSDPSASAKQVAEAKAELVSARVPTVEVVAAILNSVTTDTHLTPVIIPGVVDNAGSGQIVFLDGSIEKKVEVVRINGNAIRMTSTDGFTLNISTRDKDGQPLQFNSRGGIVVKHGNFISISGEGFAPGTLAKTWLFSSPRELGNLNVSTDGSFAADLPITDDVPVGFHVAQVDGLSPDGEVRSLSLDVEILPSEGQAEYDPIAKRLAVAALIAQSMALLALSRRREDNEGDDDREQADVSEVSVDQVVGSGGTKSDVYSPPVIRSIDGILQQIPSRIASTQQLLARIIRDGVYLRALTGVGGVAVAFSGVIVGFFAANSSGFDAVSPSFGWLLALVILGSLDALAGGMAALTIIAVTAISGGIDSTDAIRGLLGLAVLSFAIPLVASTTRPFRRNSAKSENWLWTRTSDVVLLSLFGAWAAGAMYDALPGLYGFTSSAAGRTTTVQVVVLATLIVRFMLEGVATKVTGNRLAYLAGPSFSEPSAGRSVFAIIVRTAIMLFVAEAFIGNNFALWIGAAMYAIPKLIELVAYRFPKSGKLKVWLPAGLLRTVVMLFVARWWASNISSFSEDPATQLQAAFVLLGIPSLVLTSLGWFAGGEQKWRSTPVSKGLGIVALAIGVLTVRGVLFA